MFFNIDIFNRLSVASIEKPMSGDGTGRVQNNEEKSMFIYSQTGAGLLCLETQ